MIRNELEQLIDSAYCDFSSALSPGMSLPMMGVRLPELRRIARREAKKDDWRTTLDHLGCTTFEEVLLSGMIVGYASMDLQESKERIASYVDRIDSWSLCDSACASFTVARKHPEEFWAFLMPYLDSPKEFYQRFAVVMLLDHYINPVYINKVLALLCNFSPVAYYSSMAVAWALSVCFVKFPEITIEALDKTKLDDFTYNKTLQKILESRRTPIAMRPIIKDMKRERK